MFQNDSRVAFIPSCQPMAGARAADYHVIYPANVCLRHTSNPLMSRMSDHIAYF